MEFFRTIDIKTTENKIQETFILERLEEFTDEFVLLEQINEISASIGGIWGEFTLEKSTINGGVRYALKECPNALVWTITTGYPPAPDSIIIHLTMNRHEKPNDFIEETEEFLDNHRKCIHNCLVKNNPSN
ncbi:hypothetical protein [Maribacter sp. HTCC2170]|uniref:hypothetical protein n=1 Tax=Maribacter sp. (strain HTCC2170 / KCCM 42371) TaxID=313603 RepID=UPI00006BD1D2|nr:hypothetical protein [Maribacter sp. HTCC2170]EAR02663.1 hypothetical protein FB2170_05230 [Maribacter sp. HTCC2170]